nr:translation initiation factor IF-2 [Oryctolagus cuniculus]
MRRAGWSPGSPPRSQSSEQSPLEAQGRGGGRREAFVSLKVTGPRSTRGKGQPTSSRHHLVPRAKTGGLLLEAWGVACRWAQESLGPAAFVSKLPGFPGRPVPAGISSEKQALLRPEVPSWSKRRRPRAPEPRAGKAWAAASPGQAERPPAGAASGARLLVPGCAWKRAPTPWPRPPLSASPLAAAGPRTVRRGARTLGAGLPATRGKVELGEVGSGRGAPRGGHGEAFGSARGRWRTGRDPETPGARSAEQAGYASALLL